MQINLMDPGLVQFAGHHFDIDLRVARALREDGHDVHVYAHRVAADPVVSELSAVAPVTRLFRAGPYEYPNRQDPVAGELLVYNQHSSALAKDLRSVREADLWLWPSIFAPQLHACAIAARGVPVAGCVHTDVRSEEWPSGPMFWRHALLSLQWMKIPLRLGAIEPEHRYGYLPLTTDDRFECFPIPHEGRRRSGVGKELSTIGFLGHQRQEKGTALLSDLIRRLLEEGHRVVLQDSGNRNLLQPHPNLVRTGFVPDIAELIAQCDLVVLPYDPDRYRTKGSGILWESLATGVPVVAPFGTAPGRWIEATGAGTLFSRAGADSIMDAIRAAKDRFEAITEAATKVAQRWPSEHGTKQFARALSAQFEPTGSAPTAAAE
jgi:glycosyltransferase involved in cell wall biosynthesis